MSELKASICAHKPNVRPMYDKFEVDKVIAHQKYKRCVAMARWCDIGLTYYNEKLDSFSCKRADFFYRWYNRWWKLAERLKEAKK